LLQSLTKHIAYRLSLVMFTLWVCCVMFNGETTKPQNHHTQWGWFLYWKRIAAFPTSKCHGSVAFGDGIGAIMDDVHLPALTRDWGLKNC